MIETSVDGMLENSPPSSKTLAELSWYETGFAVSGSSFSSY